MGEKEEKKKKRRKHRTKKTEGEKKKRKHRSKKRKEGEKKKKKHRSKKRKEGKKRKKKSTPSSAGEGVEDLKTNFEKYYEIGTELGSGAFSTVYKCKRKSDGQHFAVKCIKKHMIKGDELKREIGIMKKVSDHPNILALYEVYESEDEFRLVMELFDKIVERGQYSERDAADVVRQIVLGVQHLHEAGIAHRDLKPENLLCGGKNEEVIKIADFGLSKSFGEQNLQTACGTPTYVAPEVLKCEPYNMAVDMWSVGVILYILLCGYPPFFADNNPSLFKKILAAEYDFDDPAWEGVAKSAKDLVKKLLKKDPSQRLTAKTALRHAWLRGREQSTNALVGHRKKLKEYVQERKSQRNVLS